VVRPLPETRGELAAWIGTRPYAAE
jgi:hypothetical protein